MTCYDALQHEFDYTDVMLDLETVGTAPGSGIISIGAVAFAPGMEESKWSKFEVPVISFQSCLRVGLQFDQPTCDWWSRQEEAARKVYDASRNGSGAHIVWALVQFLRWFPKDACLWGNGGDFDNVLLRCAYKAAAIQAPWTHRQNRCFRTMKNEFRPVTEPPRQGVYHNALDDALHQTRRLQAIWCVVRKEA